jgi:hypothetical protein
MREKLLYAITHCKDIDLDFEPPEGDDEMENNGVIADPSN